MMIRKEKVGLCNTLVLPFEIETEILSRLPVKSLLRFKCVQKSWCNLIEDPTFITMHLNHFGKNSTSLFYGRYGSDKYYQRFNTDDGNIVGRGRYEILKSSTKRLFRGSELYIVGSCNGLVCLRNHRIVGCRIHIWNPSTRKILELPECDSGEVAGKSFQVYFLDIGFCPRLYDYKVIMIICCEDGYDWRPLGVQVYSLGTNTWKRITLRNPGWGILPTTLQRNRSIIINGASYWLAQDLKSTRRVLIVAFKFDEEVITGINLPVHHYFQNRRNRNLNMFIAEYQSLLSVITSEDNMGHVFDVWVMKEYGVADSWVKQFTIEVPLQPHKLFFRQVFMNFENNGELVLVLDDDDATVVWYNTKTNQCVKKLELLHQIEDFHWCKQSLVSLPGETSAEFLEK